MTFMASMEHSAHLLNLLKFYALSPTFWCTWHGLRIWMTPRTFMEVTVVLLSLQEWEPQKEVWDLSKTLVSPFLIPNVREWQWHHHNRCHWSRITCILLRLYSWAWKQWGPVGYPKYDSTFCHTIRSCLLLSRSWDGRLRDTSSETVGAVYVEHPSPFWICAHDCYWYVGWGLARRIHAEWTEFFRIISWIKDV